MPTLIWNRYGKSRVRLVKLRRPPQEDGVQPHEVVDLTIDVQLEGAFDSVYVDGDNRGCLATDTMKNTVYAFARHDPIEHMEAFALRLAEHFMGKPLVSSARIGVSQHPWVRISSRGVAHPHAFTQPGGEQWTTTVTRDKDGSQVRSGLANLVVLKTANSAFSGFPRDEFTLLPDTDDRVLATSITASWTYAPSTRSLEDPDRLSTNQVGGPAGFDYRSARDSVRCALIETFAAHDSRSVQHTVYAMGEAALAAVPDALEITLFLPNRHHLLVDLAPFGLDNPNTVFVPTDQPFGLIEATIRR